MSDEREKSPVLGRMQAGSKTLISVTDLVHRMIALEKQVAQIPELEARIAALEKEKERLPQIPPTVAGGNLIGNQNVAGVGRGGAATTNDSQPPSTGPNVQTYNPALVRYSSEMNLLEAVKEVQKQTGHTHPMRSIVAQHMIDLGTADKVYKFKTICTRAEKAGLVELGSGGGFEWITTKDSR